MKATQTARRPKTRAALADAAISPQIKSAPATIRLTAPVDSDLAVTVAFDIRETGTHTLIAERWEGENAQHCPYPAVHIKPLGPVWISYRLITPSGKTLFCRAPDDYEPEEASPALRLAPAQD